MAFTFRDYSSSILLSLFALSTIAVFSGAVLDVTGGSLTGDNNDTTEKLNDKLGEIKPDTSELKNDASAAGSGSGTGFVGITISTVGNVLQGLGLLPVLAQILISDIGLTSNIELLLAIPAVALIWEAISVYQAYRT